MMILCSASPRRAELLSAWGVELIISPANVLEKFQADQNLTENLLRITYDKLAAGRAAFDSLKEEQPHLPEPDELPALAADTIVHLDDRLLGKPADEKEAFDYLKLLSGTKHQVTTAFTVYLPPDQTTNAYPRAAGEPQFISGTETSTVYFNELSDDDCWRYITEFNPLDKAGSYGIQDDFELVAKYEGSFSNIVGLPMNRLLPIIFKIS